MFLKITHINSDQGLPNEQVHALDQDKLGRLWIASPAGLACYNGNSIKIFDTRSGLDCLGLRTICIAADGTVWIGTDRGLEAMDIHGNKVNLKFDFDWKYGIAESILIVESCIWVGTSIGLIKLKRINDKLELVLEEDFGLVKQIIPLDSNHILVVSAKHGLIKYSESNWRVINLPLPSADLITCLKKTLDNHYLAGTFNGLYVLNNHFEKVDHFYLNEETKKITAITVVGDEWWLAFGHKLVVVSPGNTGIKILEITNIRSIINKLFIDKTGNIWIATNNAGLKKITCLRKAFKQLDCGINNAAFSIKENQVNGKLIVGGDSFCSILSNEYTGENNSSKIISTIPSIVWDTCVDPVDTSIIWLATENGLYRSKDGAPPVRFNEENSIINSPNRVLVTRNDEIWLGTIAGLFMIKDDKVVEVFKADKNKFGYVYSLCCNKRQQLWIGTLGQGLWYETEKSFVPVVTDLITEKGNTYAVIPDTDGHMLVIQEEKIISLDEQLQTRLITREFPIAGWGCVRINKNTIAIGSNDGIIIIDSDTGLTLQRINLHLNKADWQFTSTRSIYADANEKLFCGLNSGLYSVDYNKIQQFNIAPSVYTEEILWHNVAPKKNNNGYKVPMGKWSVSVSVYAAWFIDEKQVRYRFKLIGFDENWSELSDNPNTRYNSLPSGTYELQCQAYTPLTGFGDAVTILHLNVFSLLISFGLAKVMDKMYVSTDRFFNSKRRNRALLEKNKDLQIEINERKIAELELNRYKEQLEEIVAHRTQEIIFQKERAESADKMKTAFLANMSHEIRTPLGVVIGLNELVAKTSLDAVQTDYITKINTSAHHLLQVINDILDIAKIESGKVEIDALPFSLNNILDDLTTFAKIHLSEKEVDFVIENEIRTPFLLIGDALRIKQILFNLISNAIKFTETGSIHLTIKQTNSNIDNADIYFTVADTGIGMTDDQMKNLFQAFQQGDTSITRRYGGTGLGLNICYKFIELMGGKLEVKSEFNKGSVFYFTLPLGISKELNVKLPSPGKGNIEVNIFNTYPTGFDNIRSANILVADDEMLNQFIIRKILEPEGFHVTIVSNGLECIKTLKSGKNFDLVLMDIQMPEMDGFGTTQYIRTSMKDHTIKIIGISANAFSETKDQILSYGMNDFLSKPLNVNELFALMVKWIKPVTSKN
jgi:signal transduction histidine kinase/CheY-like chemotaxis protein/ligand-binding sensor domain-containing protein